MSTCRSLSLLIGALALAGCAASAHRPAGLSPGFPQPSDEQAAAAAHDYLMHALKDPGSLQQFRLTRPVYLHEWQLTRWASWNAGWMVCFE